MLGVTTDRNKLVITLANKREVLDIDAAARWIEAQKRALSDARGWSENYFTLDENGASRRPTRPQTTTSEEA